MSSQTQNAEDVQAPPAATPRESPRRIRINLRQSGIYVAFALIVVLFAVLTDGDLLEPANISNIIVQNSYVLILAIGMILVIISGHIDLSVGSVVAVTGAICAVLTVQWGLPWWLAVLATLAAGAVIGAAQGYWIAYFGIPAFIVTLGGMLVFRALTLTVLGNQGIGPFPDEIRTLAKTLLRNPAEVQVAARNATADLVSHVLHPVAREKKRELLAYLIQTRGLKQVLVFTGTRIGANRLAHQLRRDHIHADAIHGDKTQAEREAALADFKAGKTAVLVATDVASRGLDIEGLPQVINFDVPHSPEDYVHRIGRTGRAGLAGEAISLVAPDDMDSLSAIERLIKKRIERVLIPGFEPSGATVAALMGDQPSKKSAPSVRRDRAPAKPADPIFSKPYEPGAVPPTQPKPEAPQQQSKRKQPQVAALLGGLKRA